MYLGSDVRNGILGWLDAWAAAAGADADPDSAADVSAGRLADKERLTALVLTGRGIGRRAVGTRAGDDDDNGGPAGRCGASVVGAAGARDVGRLGDGAGAPDAMDDEAVAPAACMERAASERAASINGTAVARDAPFS